MSLRSSSICPRRCAFLVGQQRDVANLSEHADHRIERIGRDACDDLRRRRPRGGNSSGRKRASRSASLQHPRRDVEARDLLETRPMREPDPRRRPGRRDNDHFGHADQHRASANPKIGMAKRFARFEVASEVRLKSTRNTATDATATMTAAIRRRSDRVRELMRHQYIGAAGNGERRLIAECRIKSGFERSDRIDMRSRQVPERRRLGCRT